MGRYDIDTEMENEAITMLKFKLVFSLGYRRMGLVELADKYSMDCNSILRELSKLGFKGMSLERIINRACLNKDVNYSIRYA